MTSSNEHWRQPREEEALLVAACKNPAVFAELDQRSLGALYRCLLTRTGNRAEAEDRTQETFLRAYHALHTYQPDGLLFLARLLRIAPPVVIDAGCCTTVERTWLSALHPPLLPTQESIDDQRLREQFVRRLESRVFGVRDARGTQRITLADLIPNRPTRLYAWSPTEELLAVAPSNGERSLYRPDDPSDLRTLSSELVSPLAWAPQCHMLAAVLVGELGSTAPDRLVVFDLQEGAAQVVTTAQETHRQLAGWWPDGQGSSSGSSRWPHSRSLLTVCRCAHSIWQLVRSHPSPPCSPISTL